MKSKTIVILVLIVCGLGGVLFLVLRQERASYGSLQMDEALFSDLPANAVSDIMLTGAESSVHLKKAAALWRVADRFDYPADFAKITDLAGKIKKLRVGRKFGETPEALDRLALYDPAGDGGAGGGRGIRVVMRDASGNVLLDVILGRYRKTAAGSGGQYLKRSGQPWIYLVDRNFMDLKAEPAEWLDRSFVKVEAAEIEKIVCRSPQSEGPIYVLQRREKGEQPVLLDAPPDKKVLTAKIDRLFGLLEKLPIEDIAGPASGPPADPAMPLFEYHLFNGLVYTLFPGGAKDQAKTGYHLRLGVAYRSAAKTGQTGTEGLAAKARADHAELADRVFVIGQWTHDAFVTDPEDFVAQAK